MLHFQDFTEITIYRFSTFLMSGPLADKQQKMGAHLQNIKFSLVTQLNFVFSTCSPIFGCFCAPDVSRFLYIFGDPGLLWGVARLGVARLGRGLP